MSTCQIDETKILEWKAPHIEKIFKHLYKNKEVSGELPIDTNNKQTTENITLIEGSKDSVQAPKSIVNYHTHPASCYLGEKTIWGFPSGEDTRESILFGLKGSIAHLVIAMEGTYVCQVNPCLLEVLVNLNIDHSLINPRLMDIIKKEHRKKYARDSLSEFINQLFRGFIILCVEVYFRSTHAFRTQDYISRYNNVTPEDYINFTNNFNFHNMFSNNTNNGCTNIKCNKIWAYETKVKQMDLEDYIQDYEDDQRVYVCSKFGEVRISGIKLGSFIKNGAIDVIKDIDFTRSEKYNFYIDSWFLTNIFYHKIGSSGSEGPKKLYKDIPNNEKIEILKQIASKNKNYEVFKIKEATFYFFDILGNCTHNSIQNSLHVNKDCSDHLNRFGRSNGPSGSSSPVRMKSLGPNDTFTFFGSDACSHCVQFLEDAKNSIGISKINVNKYPTIQEALKNASTYSGSEISSIPALFNEHKDSKPLRINHRMLLKKLIVPF
jgi:hypothetical protein